MAKDLTTDLLILQSHLDSLFERVQHNSATLKRFQEFEMLLLQLNSLVEMIEFLLAEAKVFFDLDSVSFCLLDEKGDISQFLVEDGYESGENKKLILLPDREKLSAVVGKSGHVFLGRFNAAKYAIFFKAVNDNYGHQVGDEVLAAVAEVVKKQLRSNDVFSRHGSEEFVALLTNIDEIMAYEIANRIRKTIKDLTVNVEPHEVNVTLSIGLATFTPDKKERISTSDVAASLIRNADRALYEAKKNGRDRVERAAWVLEWNNISGAQIA